jgi:hypothetical protein
MSRNESKDRKKSELNGLVYVMILELRSVTINLNLTKATQNSFPAIIPKEKRNCYRID